MQTNGIKRPPRNFWTRPGRGIVFILATTSIACLLSEFYRRGTMHTFTLFIFLPALAGLAALSLADLTYGDRQLWRGVVIGIVSGVVAAVAYDLVRLPFVFATAWGIDSMVPPLNLFKVFPAFGAMILGQTAAQTQAVESRTAGFQNLTANVARNEHSSVIKSAARTSLLKTNRPQLDQSGPNCGRVRFLLDYSFSANSILLAVSCSLPSTSLTVPVAVTFLVSRQSLPWNS